MAIRIAIFGLKIAHLMQASNSPRHHFSNRPSVSSFKTSLDLILLPQRKPGEARRDFPRSRAKKASIWISSNTLFTPSFLIIEG